MTQQERTGFCKACNRQVVVRSQGTNHVLHLLLTLATCGLWIIPWALFSIKIGGWRCSICGVKCSADNFR